MSKHLKDDLYSVVGKFFIKPSYRDLKLDSRDLGKCLGLASQNLFVIQDVNGQVRTIASMEFSGWRWFDTSESWIEAIVQEWSYLNESLKQEAIKDLQEWAKAAWTREAPKPEVRQ